MPENSATPNVQDSTSKGTKLTPCEHLDRASYWLEMAERNAFQGVEYTSLAKLAEIHIMLADRAEFRGQCDA